MGTRAQNKERIRLLAREVFVEIWPPLKYLDEPVYTYDKDALEVYLDAILEKNYITPNRFKNRKKSFLRLRYVALIHAWQTWDQRPSPSTLIRGDLHPWSDDSDLD